MARIRLQRGMGAWSNIESAQRYRWGDGAGTGPGGPPSSGFARDSCNRGYGRGNGRGNKETHGITMSTMANRWCT